jgi:hypothetical protein
MPQVNDVLAVVVMFTVFLLSDQANILHQNLELIGAFVVNS